MIIQVGTIITFPEVRDCLFGRPLCGTEKSHNVLKWLVVVDRGVMVGHPFTNHNLSFRQVVAFLYHFIWYKDFSVFLARGWSSLTLIYIGNFRKGKKKININKLSKMFEF